LSYKDLCQLPQVFSLPLWPTCSGHVNVIFVVFPHRFRCLENFSSLVPVVLNGTLETVPSHPFRLCVPLTQTLNGIYHVPNIPSCQPDLLYNFGVRHYCHDQSTKTVGPSP